MAVTNQLEIDISAKSQKATASLDSLINKLNEVNTALNRLNVNNIQNIANSLKGLKGVKVNVSGSSNATGNANNQFARANSLIQTLTSTSNKANASFLNLNKTVFKLAATWGMFYASAYPFIRALNAAWKSTQSAMDYVETYNYYSVTMDKIFSQVGEDAAESFQNSYISSLKSISEKMTGFTVGINGELFENYSKNLGADPEALMNYQARIGAVTNAVGLLAEQSVDTQKALSMLSQDLSSLTNTDLESVMTNLQSGLIGQSRSLYKYGIDITNATLKEYALENGITKAVSAMSQSEKMQLRLVAILDQSKVAWGDMANTVNSVSNQYRIFNQNVSNLSRVMGSLFLPIISKVLPYVNALLISLRQMFTLLGFKIFGDNWLKDTLDGISSGYSGGDIVDGLEDIEDAADGASGSANKLKKALMGFDELNIIDPNSSSGSGSGGGGGSFDLTDAIEAALGDYESIWNKAFADAENKAVTLANRIMAFVKKSDFENLGKWISDNLASQLNSINWDKVYAGASSFGKGLAEFILGLVQPSTFAAVGRTVANSLNTVIKFALSAGEVFSRDNGSGWKQVGESIAAYWNAIFDNFNWAEFGRTIGIWVGGITKTIATAIKNIKWDNLFDGIKEGINGFFKGLGDSGVTISDIAIVIGALTIKKILKFAWDAAALKLISQTLAKGLASRIGIEIAADAGIGTAIAQGLTVSLASVPGKLKGIWAVLGGTDEITNETITLSKAFSDAFGSIATKVVGIGSVIGGLTLSVHEFFDMWQNGWDVLSEILKDVGIAIAGVGAVLLGVVSGPVAAVIAAIVGIGSTALIVAHDQMPDIGAAISAALTVPGGTALSDLTSQASENILKVGDAFGELSGKLENNEQIKKSIEDTATSMYTIQKAMDSGVLSVEDGVKQMEEQFATLQTATETYYQNMATSILSVYGEGGVYKEGAENAMKVSQAITEDSMRLSEKQKEAFENYTKAIKNGETEEAWKWLKELNRYSVSDIEKVLNQAKVNIENINIDWTNFYDPETGAIDEEAFKAEIAKVTDAVNLSKTEIDNANNEMNASLQNYITQLEKELASTTDAAEKELINSHIELANSVIEQNNKNAEELKKSVTQMGVDVTNSIQMDFLEKMKNAITTADSDAAALQIATNMSNSMAIISGTIDSDMTKLGEDGAGWGKAATQKIISAIFSEDVQGYTESGAVTATSLSNEWLSIFDETVTNVQPKAEEMGYSFGENTTSGLAKGISENTKAITDSLNNMSQSMYDTIHDGVMNFGSPSKTAEEFGKWTDEGMAIGIVNNKGLVELAITSLSTTMITAFGTSIANFRMSLDSWFSSQIQPFFSGERWTTLGNGIRESLNTTWTSIYSDSTVKWFDIQTALMLKWDNINQDAVISWDELYATISNKWTDTLNDSTVKWNFIQKVLSIKWNEIRTDGDKQFNELEASIISSFVGVQNGIKSPINAIISMIEAMVNRIGDGFNALADAIKDLTTFDWTNPMTGEEFHSDGISLPKIQHVSIPQFAVGGFPEDGLFYANHTELVGQFSNGRTAVANNEQIVEGIRSGVASAVREELGYYLRDIADNTNATASNTDAIKNKPTTSFSDRDVARASFRGSKSMGLTLRTT